MGAFKDAAIPPCDLRAIAWVVVEESGTFPSRWDVWRAIHEWEILPDDMPAHIYEAFVTAVHAVAELISTDPKA